MPSHPSGPTKSMSTVACILVVSATLALQFLLVSVSFPLRELMTDNPLFHIDGAYHWYEMTLARNLATTGNVVGFDPYFTAGYPGGVTFNMSARVPALLAAVLSPPATQIVLYKVYASSAAVLAPAALPLAAMLLGWTLAGTIVASILGIFAWWVSYFHWYHTAGMVSFVATAYLAMFYIAAILRYLKEGGGGAALIALGLVGAAGFFLHPLFPVPIALAVVVCVLICNQETDRRRLALLLAIVPVMSLLPNLMWLLPLRHYADALAGEATKYEVFQTIVDPNMLWQELLGILGGNAKGSKLYAPILVAALWACFAAPDAYRRKLSIAFVGVAVFLEVAADVGAGISAIAKIQPNRFAAVGYLVLCLPAGIGVEAMYKAARSAAARGMARWLGIGSLALMLSAGCVLAVELAREVLPGPHGRYGAAPPEVRPLGELSIWIVDWLGKNTTRDGRILFETSKGRIHDGAHMAGYYAYSADREFIGGPYPYRFFAGFWDGWVFGKPIEAISYDAMAEYLRLYNVGWIMVHSDKSKDYFDRAPGVEALGSHGPIHVYKVRQKLTYFLEGEGRVERRGHNAVVLDNVQGQSVILKYHYVPGLRSEPPARLRPVRLMDDPVQFIEIRDPPPRLRVFLP